MAYSEISFMSELMEDSACPYNVQYVYQCHASITTNVVLLPQEEGLNGPQCLFIHIYI